MQFHHLHHQSPVSAHNVPFCPRMGPATTPHISHSFLRSTPAESRELAGGHVDNMHGKGHNPASPRFALASPFLCKTYDIVDDPLTDTIISWAHTGDSFVVWDPLEFSISVLPRSFKHSNFSSFVRQLNTYGFKKVDPDSWEFANERFVKGHKNLLKHIHRKKSPQHPRRLVNTARCTPNLMDKESPAQCEDANAMKREKNILKMEVIRLRQCQQQAEEQVKAMLNQLRVVKQRQHHMVAFIARALYNPAFIAQLVHDNSSPECLDTAKMRHFLPASAHGVLDVTEKPQLCGALRLSTIPTSKQVQEPHENNRRTYMLLKLLASDVETGPAHLEAFIQEMECSLTTNSNAVKMEQVGGCASDGLPVDAEPANKLFGISGQGSSPNMEFGLPYVPTEGDNPHELRRIAEFDCKEGDVPWEQLILGPFSRS